jgi:hypothetical protein
MPDSSPCGGLPARIPEDLLEVNALSGAFSQFEPMRNASSTDKKSRFRRKPEAALMRNGKRETGKTA